MCVQNTKAEPQAELPEAQSDINAVKKENEEDMKKIEDHRNTGNLQDEMSERPAASPFMKLPAHHSLQNLNEKLQEEQQESLVRLEERKKRLEENIKIIEEKMNPLLRAVQKQVSKRVISTGVTKLVVSALLVSLHQAVGGGVMPPSTVLLWSLEQLL